LVGYHRLIFQNIKFQFAKLQKSYSKNVNSNASKIFSSREIHHVVAQRHGISFTVH